MKATDDREPTICNECGADEMGCAVKAGPPRDLEPEPPTPDDLARSLVRRGLASAQIIGPSEPTHQQAQTQKENRS